MTDTLTRTKRLTAPTMRKIRRAFEEHLKARRLAEDAKHQQDSYRDILRDDYLMTYGTEDSNGNRWIVFPEDDPVISPDGTPVYGMKAQRRVTVSLDEEAAQELIKAKGLEKKCLRKVVTYEIDEDALLSIAFSDPDVISDDEIKGLYNESAPSYSFVQVKKPTSVADLD